MDAVGIDAGGTFTDLVQLELGSGRIRAVHKRPSSPAQPAQAVLEAFAATGASPHEVRLVHGSTVATNALLERTLATTALVTNAGFEDAIEIGRQHRPRLYALQPRRARPLVPRALRFGIGGRIGPRGERWEPLDPGELAALRERLGRSGAETIAVCLLHSYRDGGDERELARALAPLGLPITCSHAVLPEHREFERCSTTVVNAALIPRMRRYLAALAPLGDGLWIMRSDGGVGAAAAIAEQPVWTLLSGPAGGVVGAELAAARAGIGPFLSIDVGGTSSDVALGGAPLRAGAEIGGIEVAHPSVDLVTIGAGGGSIAWRDAGGALRVGPRSAGADPGPACYGRGGTEPTLTDACLLLGRLPDTGLLGGAFPLERERAEHAIARLARAFDLAPLALARGIVAVALEATTRALRRVSVERGEDPRERALVAFGGAGGLLAGDLVRSLGLRGALVPPEPGVLSALGMAGAPLTLRLAETLLEPLEPAGSERLAEAFARLERQAREQLGHERRTSSLRWIREVDLRYAGQGHSVRIVWRAGEERARFEAQHRRRNGFTEPDRPIELVCARLTAVLAPHDDAAANAAPAPPPTATPSRAAPPAAGQTRHGPVHERAALAPGDTLPGPAIVTEYSGTTVVPEGMVLRVLADGGLWIEERER